MKAVMKAFISHASDDKDRFVRRFAERLMANGVNVWLDEWEINPGDNPVRKIFDEGLATCQVAILVMSEKSTRKPWVREELDAAFVRKVEGRAKLIPLRLDRCTMPECLKTTRWEPIDDLVGAIEGLDRYIRPDQVTRMTDAQAAAVDDHSRAMWAKESLRKSGDIPGRWYAANTREPIRDETLREGLIRTGAAIARENLPTTSARPRYALTQSFAALFDPALRGKELGDAIRDWQNENLSAGALARVRLLRKGATASAAGVLVTFPNGETDGWRTDRVPSFQKPLSRNSSTGFSSSPGEFS